MADQTYKGSVLSNYIKELLIDNRETIVKGGVDAIFYGDQRIIVGGKTLCVEPSRKLRSIRTAGHCMLNDFETSIIVYGNSDRGPENVQIMTDELTEAVEDLLNVNASPVALGLGGNQLNGLIGNGFVSSIEHGYRLPKGQLTRANRVLFTSQSRTELKI